MRCSLIENSYFCRRTSRAGDPAQSRALGPDHVRGLGLVLVLDPALGLVQDLVADRVQGNYSIVNNSYVLRF